MFFGKRTLALKDSVVFNADDHVLTIADKVSCIWLDSNLYWSVHTNYVADKISRNIGMIRYASKFLPVDVLIKMYYAFIYPYLTYAISVWGSAPNCYLQPIVIL